MATYGTPKSSQDNLAAIILELDDLLTSKENYNYTPVLAIPISQDNGIEILGRFIFKDTVKDDLGPMCYVTVRRDMNHPFPHNGFGFAFSAVDTDTGSYNVYLVDNDVLIQDVFMYNNMVIQNEGINNFLAAGRHKLFNNTWYKFKFVINEYYGTKLWIVEDSVSTFVDTPYSYNSVITSGGYTATMGAQYSTAASGGYLYAPMSSGNGFGIGVLNTKGGIWQFDNIQINSTLPTYPFVYYKLSIPVSDFPTTKPVELRWYGYGDWDNASSSGVQLWILKYPDSAVQWEKVGTSYWKPPETLPGNSIEQSLIYKKIDDISLYRDSWGFAHVYATTTSAHAITNLHTEYIGFNTWYPSGVHQGGMSDVFVTNSTNVVRTTSSGMSLDGSGFATLSKINCLTPIMAIRQVYANGVPLVLGIDYEVVNNSSDYTYSVECSHKIVAPNFPSLTLTVDYFYYKNGNTIQNYISSESVRNPASSVLIKHVAPAIVSIENLEYSGGPDAATMRLYVKQYIQGLDRELDLSKLIIFMQSVGATAFNLDTIAVQVCEYGLTNEVVFNDFVINRYLLSSNNLSTYVTDEIELAGIVKV